MEKNDNFLYQKLEELYEDDDDKGKEFSQTNASICRHDCKNGNDRTRHHFLIITEKSSLHHFINMQEILAIFKIHKNKTKN